MDELFRSRLHEALDAVPAPPALRAIDSIPVRDSSSQSARAVRLDWAYGAIAAVLAVAIVAGLLYVRGLHQNVPSHPTIHATPARPWSGMVTPTAGWYIGPGGHVFRTTDAGRTWIDVTPSNYVSTDVSPYFFDADNAWITEDASSKSVLTLRTSDGGKNWQRGAPITVPGLNAFGPMTLFFLDSDRGWLLGSSIDPVLPLPQSVGFEFVYGTTDGGAHWKRLADTRSHAPACPWSYIAFSSPTTGWITTFCGPSGRPALVVSHDGGATWETDTLPATPGDGSYLPIPQFFDPNRGVLWVDSGGEVVVLLATSDGGTTWSRRNLPGEVAITGAFLDAEQGWVVAGPAALARNDTSSNALPLPLYRTDDGGVTWKSVTNNLTMGTPHGRVQDVYFVSAQSGFAVAVETAPYTTGSRTLYRTDDGGGTWTLVGPIPT